MTPQEYIDEGVRLRNEGRRSNGCSFVGRWMNKKYITACWAHDFARAGLFGDFKDQGENDLMFRKALRLLGMPKWSSNLVYYFTYAQGWFQDRGVPVMGFVAGLFFACFFLLIFILEQTK